MQAVEEKLEEIKGSTKDYLEVINDIYFALFWQS